MPKLSWDPWLMQNVSINHTSPNSGGTWSTVELISYWFHVMIGIITNKKSYNTWKKVANAPTNIVTLRTHSINTEVGVRILVISLFYRRSIQLLHKISRRLISLWLSSNNNTWQYAFWCWLEGHNCNFNLSGIFDFIQRWCFCDNGVNVILWKFGYIKHMVW